MIFLQPTSTQPAASSNALPFIGLFNQFEVKLIPDAPAASLARVLSSSPMAAPGDIAV